MASHRLITQLVIGLTLFGLLMISSASVITAARDFGDKWYYLKLQSGWAVFGLIGFFLASRFPHTKLQSLAPAFFACSLLLLAAVLIPGIGTKLLGARRWINLGIFSFQPAELAKLSFILYLSSLFKKSSVKFVPFIISLVVCSLLIIFEPDLGTTLILSGTGILMYFGSNGKIFHLATLIPIALLAVFAIVTLSPYRAARLKTFFDYTHDPLGASYQIRQSLLGLGSGGLLGRGLGQSRQKYEFLPEVATDSIFAVIGEELGLLGTLGVVAAFMFLIYHGFQIAANTHNPFSANLALGITSWIGLQAMLNMSSLVALTPLTGIPLPFISYGGSSLVILLLASGILVNIGRSSKN